METVAKNKLYEGMFLVDSSQAGAEKPLLAEAIERAREAVLCWIEYGIEKTMNEFIKI